MASARPKAPAWGGRTGVASAIGWPVRARESAQRQTRTRPDPARAAVAAREGPRRWATPCRPRLAVRQWRGRLSPGHSVEIAHALAPQLRVVGVAPGLTLTSHLISEEKFQQLHRLSPLGRSSSAADVAAAVRFALENPSITGTTLLVDGGQHLMRFERDFSLM